MTDQRSEDLPAVVIEAMKPANWESVRAIYEQGIITGNATFETEAPDWEQWNRCRLEVARLVARCDGQVVGWAVLSPVSTRPVYAGVAEVSLYVAASARGRGVGTSLLRALIETSEKVGIWTLQGSIFPENAASLSLVKRCGFREVGRRERIGQRNGVWRDTILVEHAAEWRGCSEMLGIRNSFIGVTEGSHSAHNRSPPQAARCSSSPPDHRPRGSDRAGPRPCAPGRRPAFACGRTPGPPDEGR